MRRKQLPVYEYERCEMSYAQRRILTEWMPTATRETTLRNLYRSRRSVFGDYPEVAFDAWRDLPDSDNRPLAAD